MINGQQPQGGTNLRVPKHSRGLMPLPRACASTNRHEREASGNSYLPASSPCRLGSDEALSLAVCALSRDASAVRFVRGVAAQAGPGLVWVLIAARSFATAASPCRRAVFSPISTRRL